MKPNLDVKKIVKYINHFNKCFAKENRCLHCLDCIAFALLYAEDNNLTEPSAPVEYMIEGDNKFWNFKKFLLSTIVNDPYHQYLPCKNALTYDEVWELADLLLKLAKKQKKTLRRNLLCHTEFKADQFTGRFKYGLLVLEGEKLVPVENYEAWKREHEQ